MKAEAQAPDLPLTSCKEASLPLAEAPLPATEPVYRMAKAK